MKVETTALAASVALWQFVRLLNVHRAPDARPISNGRQLEMGTSRYLVHTAPDRSCGQVAVVCCYCRCCGGSDAWPSYRSYSVRFRVSTAVGVDAIVADAVSMRLEWLMILLLAREYHLVSLTVTGDTSRIRHASYNRDSSSNDHDVNSMNHQGSPT